MKFKNNAHKAAALGLAFLTVSLGAQNAKPVSKPVHSSAFAGPLQTAPTFNRLIVQFKAGAKTRSGAFDVVAAKSQVTGLGKSADVQRLSPQVGRLSYFKSISNETHVVLTDKPMGRAELFALAQQIQQDPSVAYAEVDEIMRPLAAPNDPGYALQWHYKAPADHVGGANVPAAWSQTRGSGVVVAVIDTGIRPHVDLAANILPGYDFISDAKFSSDGDGLDSDATDPGDRTTAGQCGVGSPAEDSSWHGTHVAGTVAAVTDNAQGGAGVAPAAKILPVRALGACGGWLSDVAAGLRWAAGLSVTGVPNNPDPARVLNLSLGVDGACSVTFQQAVNDVRAKGSVVVAATGNDGLSTNLQPANCAGVIAVTGHTEDGDSADYANVGVGTTLSAPGGGFGTVLRGAGEGIYSTLNAGTTVPAADSYAQYQGTSMASPHVAGAAALLLSLQPSMLPDAVSSVLVNSVRPHPAGTYCATTSGCGAGLLDVNAAVQALVTNTAPVISPIAAQTVVLGSNLSFQAQATDREGNRVVFVATGLPAGSELDAASGLFTWNNAGPVGSYTLTITPSDGVFSGPPVSVNIQVVNATPGGGGSTSGGGGGGGCTSNPHGTDGGLLLLLSLALIGWLIRQRSARPMPQQLSR